MNLKWRQSNKIVEFNYGHDGFILASSTLGVLHAEAVSIMEMKIGGK